MRSRSPLARSPRGARPRGGSAGNYGIRGGDIPRPCETLDFAALTLLSHSQPYTAAVAYAPVLY